MWHFFVPLVIFVCAYWKILVVVRRRAKVAADRQKATGKAKNQLTGTSRGTAETKMTDVEVTKKVDASQKEVSKESTTAMSKGRRQEGEQQRPAGLSQAKINVMKTMIYIVICFIVCWMPRNVYVLYMQFAVMHINSLMLYSTAHKMSMPLFL